MALGWKILDVAGMTSLRGGKEKLLCVFFSEYGCFALLTAFPKSQSLLCQSSRPEYHRLYGLPSPLTLPRLTFLDLSLSSNVSACHH